MTTVTTGQTAVPLVAGTYSADGVSYGYRSAQLTAKATLAAGPLAFSVTATDQASGSTTTGFSVTGDNTVPSASASRRPTLREASPAGPSWATR